VKMPLTAHGYVHPVQNAAVLHAVFAM